MTVMILMLVSARPALTLMLLAGRAKVQQDAVVAQRIQPVAHPRRVPIDLGVELTP